MNLELSDLLVGINSRWKKIVRLLLLTLQNQWSNEYCDIMPGVPSTVILAMGEPSSSSPLMIWGRRGATSFFVL